MTAQLDQLCEGRDNNLNLIRFLAATCVLVSHAFPITLGAGAAEPLEHILGRSLGWVSVAIFFVISGFLITQSFQRSTYLVNWTMARILRIFPGLVVVLLATALIIGPIVSTLSAADYFSSRDTLSYVPRNLSLAFLQYPLPGIFADNAYPGVINGSLWTLIHEVMCYALVFGLGVMGLFGSKKRSAIALLLLLAAYFGVKYLDAYDISHPRLTAFFRLALPFAIGIALYQWRSHVPMKWRYSILLGLAAIATYWTIFFAEAFVLWLSYTVFLLAYLPDGFIRRFNNLGDYSYGMYIYAFPVQQHIAHYITPQSPIVNIIIAIPITLLLAILSWTFVEKPALDKRRDVSETARNWLSQIQAIVMKRTES